MYAFCKIYKTMNYYSGGYQYSFKVKRQILAVKVGRLTLYHLMKYTV